MKIAQIIVKTAYLDKSGACAFVSLKETTLDEQTETQIYRFSALWLSQGNIATSKALYKESRA